MSTQHKQAIATASEVVSFQMRTRRAITHLIALLLRHNGGLAARLTQAAKVEPRLEVSDI